MRKNISFLAAFLAAVIFADGFNHPDLAVVHSLFAAVLVAIAVKLYPFRVLQMGKR